MVIRKQVDPLIRITEDFFIHSLSISFGNHKSKHKCCQFVPEKCEWLEESFNQIAKTVSPISMKNIYDRLDKCDVPGDLRDCKKAIIRRYLSSWPCASFRFYEFKDLESISYKSVAVANKIVFDENSYKDKLDNKVMKLTCDILFNASNLTQLVIHFTVDYLILNAIGLYCNNLRHLAVAYEPENPPEMQGFSGLAFTDLNMTQTGLCSTLEVLAICTQYDYAHKTRICHYIMSAGDKFESICKLVEYLPNLKAFMFFAGGHVLRKLHEENRNFSKNIVCVKNSFTIEKDIKVLKEKCPELYQFSNLYSVDTGSFLTNLTALENIQFLYLGGQTHPENLRNYMKSNGCTLRKLEVRKIYGHLDISEIAHYCPNMEELAIGSKTFSYSNRRVKFPFLEKLILLTPWIAYTESEDLINLLQAIPLAKHVQMDNCLNITNSILLDIMHKVELNHLEVLRFSKCDSITLVCAYRLVSHFPNLKVLGNVHSMIKKQDRYFDILNEIANNNLDFTLEDINTSSEVEVCDKTVDITGFDDSYNGSDCWCDDDSCSSEFSDSSFEDIEEINSNVS